MASSSPAAREPGGHEWCWMSEPRQIDDTLWEIPADARPDMRVPARIFADAELDRVLTDGSRVVGSAEDVERTESDGRLAGADPAAVSDRAKERGAGQLGTMGSGNHFVEVQRVERLLDERAAEAYGLREGQVTILIHSGSRGFGHQV